MIERQTITLMTAVLTGVIVAIENVAAGKGDFSIWYGDVVPQPNHCGKGKVPAEKFTVVFDRFCFSFEHQDRRTSPTSDVERLVGSI